VDRNTLFQERGKYARVCVEVNLNEPLLAMFELKDETYKVEYEGLHMLCRTCGKFGHYLEGCPDKKTPNATNVDTDEGGMTDTKVGANLKSSNSLGGDGDGPWVVVQKTRRPRKAKEGTGKENIATGVGRNTGNETRFEILESINEDSEIDATNNEERNISDTSTIYVPNPMHGKWRGKTTKHVGDKKGKAAENKVHRESTKNNTMQVNNSGIQTDNNIQILKRPNKEGLARKGNQGNDEISQREVGATNQQGNKEQAPHNTKGGCWAAPHATPTRWSSIGPRC
jgi:hypothetical protein